jgi:hypothetical protein
MPCKINSIHFSFVEFGDFVVMPNHILGILIINILIDTRFIAYLQEKISDKNIGGICGNKNPMFYENISRIIRWYKAYCSFESRKIDSNFDGNPVLMIILFVIQNDLISFKIILLKIHQNGKKRYILLIYFTVISSIKINASPPKP